MDLNGQVLAFLNTLNVAVLRKMLQLSKLNFWTKFGYIYLGNILFVPTPGEPLRTLRRWRAAASC